MELKLINIIERAPKIKSFRFKRPSNFNYNPGQFIMVVLKIKGVLQRRAYSLSSSPTEDFLEITVKKVPNGIVSTELFKQKKGNLMEVKGPYGIFGLDKKHMKNLVFVAGGIGVTPMRSFLKYIVDKKLKNVRVSLVYGCKNPESIVFYKEFKKIDLENKNIDVVFIVEEDKKKKWKGYFGYTSIGFIQNCAHDFRKAHYYICGPDVMVHHIMNDLDEVGVDTNKIHHEKW